MMRKVENRHPLCRPLEAEEIETLEPLSKFHPYPDFRRRALGLLALNSGRRVVDICEILRVSDPPVYNSTGPRAGVKRDWSAFWRDTKAELRSS